jgi:flagellar basal body rod protein FlgB
VVAKLRERLSVSKEATQKFDMKRFGPKKLNDAEVKENYQIKISNRFAALENLGNNVDINKTW